MRSSTEISFRYADEVNNVKEKSKVNLFSGKADNDGELNFARCTRVLRRLDTCPGEKINTNTSIVPNFSTMSRNCNTREASWAEDFIDLSAYCQPSSIPIKMEDFVDEHASSPISSTVHDRGFDYALEVNDGLDVNLEDDIWCIPSPSVMQEELCDPISDWLAVTKETNNNNDDNSSSRFQTTSISSSSLYNIKDTLLSPTLMSVPNISQHYDREQLNFVDEKQCSPPLQPDTTFFHSDNTRTAFHHHDNRNPPTLTENLTTVDERLAENFLRKSQHRQQQPPPQSKLPPANTIFNHDKNADSARNLLSNQFFDVKSDLLGLSRATINTKAAAAVAATSGSSIQSPSITQSTLIIREQKTQSSITARRNAQLPKLKIDGPSGAPSTSSSSRSSSCTMNTPEMLQPLVHKHSDFDLVSYVFDDNKPPISLDLSGLQNSDSSSDSTTNVRNEIAPLPQSPVVQPAKIDSQITIKTEPKEETPNSDEEDDSLDASGGYGGGKRNCENDEKFQKCSKRLRRYSNCSSIEDVTQIESGKYRELRNRNNEASRRSRANRKSREVEMKDHASQLEAENRRLKVKAQEMEQLVKRLRNCLMQLVLNRR